MNDVTMEKGKKLVSPTRQKVGKDIEKRIKESIQEVHTYNKQAREDEATLNVFCPTGVGGGIDPTCSPGGTGSGKGDSDGPKDTMEKFQVDGKWSADRVAAVHKPVLDRMMQGVEQAPNGEPVLRMTGGGMGSGKSSLMTFASTTGMPAPHEAVRVDPDAIKPSIPEYNDMRSGPNAAGAATYVHEESADIAKAGVKLGLSTGKSVLYDTSGDSGIDKLASKVEGFRRQGATRVDGDYVFAGSFEEVQRRVDARAQKTGRFVPPAVLAANHRDVARTWFAAAERKTYDNLKLWSTAGKIGDPPSLIAHAKDGKITVVDNKLFSAFKEMAK